MKFIRLFLVALGSISVLVSCNTDDNSGVAGAYDKGILILNEGSSGQGSVSFLSNDLANFSSDIYTDVNTGDLLGKYAQSIFFNGDKAYIIASGTNTINVINRYTFKLIDKIDSGLVAPRYGAVVNGKAYVVNANTYSYTNPATGNTDDYVAVINLETNTIESTIALNATGNRIVLENGKLYITESYNNDKVLVVNPSINALETPITIGTSGDTMEAKDGYLYVLRSPYGASSELVKIKLSDKTFTSIAFPSSLDGAGNLDIYGNDIYYTVGTSVYKMGIIATVASTNPVLSYTSTSGVYGFAVHNGHIFVGDTGDYTANCSAYVYSLSGSLEKTLTVGVLPNGFYFND